jgi:putative molybdopterin biosynthesis protein
MQTLRRIQNFEMIKMLSDARRLEVLRRLMAEPATLSQLGEALGEHPARVRHHLKLLEKAGLVEMVSTHVVRGFVEKYYRARAQAYIFQELILPYQAERKIVVAIGSHDLALEMLAQQASLAPDQPLVLTLPVGSLDGLISLRQGLADLAGSHMLDPASGEFNLPLVRQLFPDRPVALITLAHRQQGLIVTAGNPLQIQELSDLARSKLVFINRNVGSGTRVWLDHKLQEMGLNGQAIVGYNREVRTHTQVAEQVSRGKADVGLGLEAAARQAGLDFVPLFQERYDLVIPKDQVESQLLSPLLEILNSDAFRKQAALLSGYDTTHTGEMLLP